MPRATDLSNKRGFGIQVYFIPDPVLSSIPFAAFKVGWRHFLIQKAPVAQAPSLHALFWSQSQWKSILCEGKSLSPKVGFCA